MIIEDQWKEQTNGNRKSAHLTGRGGVGAISGSGCIRKTINIISYEMDVIRVVMKTGCVS